ncbi:hypothetical protein BJ742DRAFT_817747 [Cladochytrium replicatum]|nr:hypothetical protein BJ742DRAFT_817747 [Cladochytrium replicatum]
MSLSPAEEAISLAKAFIALYNVDPSYHTLEKIHAVLLPGFEHHVFPQSTLPTSSSLVAVKTFESTPGHIKNAVSLFKSLRYHIRLAFADETGTHVEIKATSEGVSKTGFEYKQDYSFYFEIRKNEKGEKRVYRFEEFVDSMYSLQFFKGETQRLAAAAKSGSKL